MSENAKGLAQLLKNMQTPNDEAIKLAESQIQSAAGSNPDAFVSSLLEILAGEFEPNTKQSACIWLHKAFSPYQEGLPNLFTQINGELRERFKTEVFATLVRLGDAKVSNNLADTIGEIAGAIAMDQPTIDALNGQEPWAQVFVQTLELFAHKDERLVEAGLRVINNINMYCSQKYVNHTENVKGLLQGCLENGNTRIRVKAIEVIGGLISTLPVKYVKAYLGFAVPLLRLTDQIVFAEQDIDSGSKILGTFSEIVETEPKFFRKNFGDLVDLMTKIRNCAEVEVSIKNQCIELVISLSQRYPEVLKADTALLTKVTEMVFTQMVDIPDEISEEWQNPPDGFNEDDEDQDDQNVCKFCMDCIDRLLGYVGPKVMLPFLSSCIQKLMSTENWKYIHASFMALSQIGEYMTDKVEEIEPILVKIEAYIDHENPRIRYACLHAIGQLADDLAPEFQILYHHRVLPMLAKRLQDPVPRVLGHACASLTNHLEHCNDPEAQIKPEIEGLFKHLWTIIQNSSVFVREHALSAISSLSVGAGEKVFAPFYDENMTKLLQIIENCSQDEYKKLRGSAIECASITSKTMGKERFAPYCDRLVGNMLHIQEEINNGAKDGDDPQMSYLLTAWERVSGIMGEDFFVYLDRIMPSCLALCNIIIEKGLKYDEQGPVAQDGEEGDEAEDGGKAQKFNQFEDDNCFIAMNMIKIFLKRCGAALEKHVPAIFQAIVPLMGYLPNDTVREVACQSLPNLVLALKNSGRENVVEFAREASTKLWKVMDEELEAEILIQHARAMQKLIEFSGEYLTDQMLGEFYQKCIEHLKKSDERKQQTDEHKDEEDDKDVEGVLEYEKNLEDEFHCQIAEIFGRLFMTHKARTIPIVQKLDEQFIATSLQESQPPRIIKFGLFLMDDIIDNLGDIPDVRTAYFEKYYGYLIKYSTHDVIYVRHAAVYGVGSMAKAIKGEFMPLFENSAKKLVEAIAIPMDSSTSKDLFLSFQDNAKAAFGKIIEAVMDQLAQNNMAQLKEVLNKWLNYLPLKTDLEEAKVQHNMLLKILTLQDDLLVGSNDPESIRKVLDCFITIYTQATAAEDRNSLMKAILSRWSQDAGKTAAMEGLKLEAGLKSQLLTIMNSN